MKSARKGFQQCLILILIFQICNATNYSVTSNTVDERSYNSTTRNEDAQTESSEEYDNTIEGIEPTNTNGSIESEILYRLPNTTFPSNYFLHITTNIHRGILDYNGNCTIEIMVLENTNELIMHAHNLNIFKILIEDLTTQKSLKSISFKVRNQMLIIFSTENDDDSILTTKSFMLNHRLRLEIHYSSVISEVSLGFYKMTYTKEGAAVIGASTQFEPLYARNALPCYDEPRFKSKFTLRITHGSNYTAISNMPDDGKPLAGLNNMTTTTFLETPKMSVFLLAFVISNFKNTSMQTKNVLQRVFLPPNADYLNTSWFLGNAIDAMKAFEELVDTPYTLPKLDHMILNESFGKGMENWGLITYLGSRLFNNLQMDTKDDFDILEVLTHEIVHQWFGNLVTPEWWSYIWLSEGFATYYSHVLIDILRPKYRTLPLYQLLICNEDRTEFDSDFMTSHVETPLDIKNSFNKAAYIKAGCIVQMFEHAFGQQVFRSGISKYLKAHAYSTVNELDFFDAIQSALVQHHESWNNSVHEIMYTWTHSKIFPTIRITRNYGDQSSIIHLEQVPVDIENNELFWVPINFITAANASFENTSADFFMPPVNEFSIDLKTFGLSLKADDWLLANKKGTGFYGVIYDSTNMNLITTALRTNHSQIHAQNRISFFFDISNSKTKLKSTEHFIERLECIKYLKHEQDPLVLTAALPLMNALIKDFKSDDLAYKQLREYLLQIVLPIYERLSNLSAVEIDVIDYPLSYYLEDLVCTLEVNECLLARKKSVLKFIANESYSEYETIVQLCSAVKVFTEEEFETALDFFVDQKKLKIWTGLGCTQNDTLYENLLEKTLDMIEDEKCCQDKLISFLDFLTKKQFSERKITWKILRKNMLRIVETAPCVDFFFEKLNKNLNNIDEAHKEDLRSFYELYSKRNGTVGAFDETVIGKDISKEFIEAKIFTGVTKWLRKELQNSAAKRDVQR